jgi:NAD(P)-dependent dehydrogenase (short-subunit alcohol dehydrogenase family)
MNQIKDRVALVTGGTKGIGWAIAEALVKEQAKVVVSARHGEEVRRAIQQMRDLNSGPVDGTVCDVREYAQVKALLDYTEQTFGGLDILVNNAGVGQFGRVDELTPEQWRQVIDTNLSGVFYCCHEAVPRMKARGGGYIINIGSLAGKNAFAGGAAYNASKFGLIGFSEALMLDIRYDNIRVSYVMPGSVNTEFGGDTPDPSKDWQLQPADVAQVVIDLLKFDARAMPSRVEIRPSKPPRK